MTIPLFFLYLIWSFLTIVSPYIIGVDLGTEYFKVCVIKPGKPFTMMENLQSQTKTRNTISLKDDEIVFGWEAIAKKARFPKNIFTFFSEYLGRTHNSTFVQNYLETFLVSYDITEDPTRGSINFDIKFNNENEWISIEELYAMLFNHIKFLSEKYAHIEITDVYVTVPSFFDYKQREALAQAIEISDLKWTGFINENLAAAVQFQLKKTFENETFYIFYDMGSSYTQASLVSFKTLYDTKNNNTVDLGNEVTVYGETWDNTLGGNEFSRELVMILMKKFDELPVRQGKTSVIGNKVIYEKLLPNANKYKDVLSSNKEAHVTIWSIDSGVNLECKVTREEFLTETQHLLDRVYTPIQQLIERAGENITLANITQIELLGGGIRVPQVQETIKSKLIEQGGDEKYSDLLGIHLNGDDAMAYGTAYLAANVSSKFKGSRKTFMTHGANNILRIYLSNLKNETWPGDHDEQYCNNGDIAVKETELKEDCVHKLDKNTTIIPLRYGYGNTRTVSLVHDTDIYISWTEQIPYTKEEEEIINYKITGVNEFVERIKSEKIGTQPKIVLKFGYSKSGQINLSARASYNVDWYLGEHGDDIKYTRDYAEPLSEEVLQEIDWQWNTSKVIKQKEIKKIIQKRNITETNSILNSTGNTTDKAIIPEIYTLNNLTEEERLEYLNGTNYTQILEEKEYDRLKLRRKIGHKKVDEIKRELHVNITNSIPKPMTFEDIQNSKRKLKRFHEINLNRTKWIELKNTMESLIYNKKEWLETDKAKWYANETELEITQVYLNNISNWYEEDGFAANYDVWDIEIKNFTNHFKVYDNRLRIHYERMQAITKFSQELNATHEKVGKWLHEKPWVEDYYNKTFINDITSVIRWFNESYSKQENLTLYEPPYLTVESLKAKTEIIRRSYYRMTQVQKPKDVKPDWNDWLKGGESWEDLIRKANITKEEFEKIQDKASNNTTGEESGNENEESGKGGESGEGGTKSDL